MLDQQDLSHRRRFVYHGLNGHLPDESVRAAVKLCDEEFARDPAFSLVKFLDRLSTADRSAAALRPTLFVALQRARLKPLHELDADPRPAPTAPTNPSPRSSSIASTPAPRATPRINTTQGWHDIMNVLLTEFFETLRRMHPSLAVEAAQSVARDVGNLGLTPSTLAEVRRWLESETPQFTARTDRREMHEIIHSLYRWACDKLGPVETDKILTGAIREADKHPVAVRFSPSALL